MMFSKEELEVIFDMLSYCCTEHPEYVEHEQERQHAIIEKVHKLLKAYDNAQEL